MIANHARGVKALGIGSVDNAVMTNKTAAMAICKKASLNTFISFAKYSIEMIWPANNTAQSKVSISPMLRANDVLRLIRPIPMIVTKLPTKALIGGLLR